MIIIKEPSDVFNLEVKEHQIQKVWLKLESLLWVQIWKWLQNSFIKHVNNYIIIE